MEKNQKKSNDSSNYNGSIGDDMDDFNSELNHFIDVIKNSYEYKNYHEMLENIMHNKELYDRMNEFRRKKFKIQLEYKENSLEELESLRNEYIDIFSNLLTRDFLSAEQKICRLARQVQERVSEALELDIDNLF